jgi:hypothetical protein
MESIDQLDSRGGKVSGFAAFVGGHD